VRDGAFAAIVAEGAWQAIAALRRLQATGHAPVAAPLQALPAQDITILAQAGPWGTAAHWRRARYTRPWLSHGSIGPSCALALFRDNTLTIWTHSQATYDVRRVAAELLGLPVERVHAIHVEGSGCQNGADDAAAEAAHRHGPARAPGAAATDAGTGIRLGAAEPRHGHGAGGRHRREEPHHRLAARGLEQPPQQPPGVRRRRAGGAGGGQPLHGAGTQANPDAGMRRQPQFQPALRAAGHAGGLSFPGDAAARLGSALAGRASERRLNREHVRRAGRRRGHRPAGAAAGAYGGCPGAR
jgi:hypothetical protein